MVEWVGTEWSIPRTQGLWQKDYDGKYQPLCLFENELTRQIV